MSDAASVITWGREVLANRRLQKRNESQPLLQRFQSSQSVSSQLPANEKPASHSARSAVSIQSSSHQAPSNNNNNNGAPRQSQQPRSGTQTRQHSGQFLPQTLAPPPDDDSLMDGDRMDDGGHVYQRSGVREDSSTARSPALLLNEHDRRRYVDENIGSEYDAAFGGRTTGRQSVQSKKSASASSTPQALAETTKILEIEALQRRLDAEKWQLKELRAVKLTNEKAFQNREEELHSLLELAYRHHAAEEGGAPSLALLNGESQHAFTNGRPASQSNALSVKQPLQQATLEELWESQRLLLDGLEEEEILGGALVELTDVVTQAGGMEKSVAESFFQILIAMKLRVLPSLRSYGANVNDLTEDPECVAEENNSHASGPDSGDEELDTAEIKQVKLSSAVAAALRPIDDVRLPETDSVQNLPSLKKLDAALNAIDEATKAVTATLENLGRLTSAAKHAQTDELRNLRDTLTGQRKRLDESSAALKERQQRHAALIAERAQLREDTSNLEKQTFEKQEENKRVKGSNEEKRRTMAELEAAVSLLRQKKQKAVFYRKDLDEEIARCKSETTQTNGTIEDLRQTLASAESATERRRMDMIKAKHELHQIRQEEERCGRVRNAAEQENARVQERLQELRSTCKAVEHDISDMDDRTTQNAFDDANLKRKVAAVEHECVTVREAAAALRDDVHAIRASMDEVNRDVAAKQTALEKEANTLLELQEELKVAQAVLLYRDEVPKLNPEQRAEWLNETRELLRASALSPTRISSQLKRSSTALSPNAALTPAKDAMTEVSVPDGGAARILSPVAADSDSMSTPQRSTMRLDDTISPTLIHYDLTTPFDKPVPSLLLSPTMDEHQNGASHPANHAPTFSDAITQTAPFQREGLSSVRTRKSDKSDGAAMPTVTSTGEAQQDDEDGLVMSDVVSNKVSSSSASENKSSLHLNSMHVVPQQRYEQRDYDELTRVHEEQWQILREDARVSGKNGNRHGDNGYEKARGRHHHQRSSRSRSATSRSYSSSDSSYDSPSPSGSRNTEDSSPYHFTYSSSSSSSPSPEATGIPNSSNGRHGGGPNTRTVPRVVSRPSRSDFSKERRKTDDLHTTHGLLYCEGSPLTSYHNHSVNEKKLARQIQGKPRHDVAPSPKDRVESKRANMDVLQSQSQGTHSTPTQQIPQRASPHAKSEIKQSQPPRGPNSADTSARRHHDTSTPLDSSPSGPQQTSAMRERLELLRKKISQRDHSGSGQSQLR